MGEGGGSLRLGEYEHAAARGARIYAEVVGYSLNNDAFHMTTPLPSGESCIRAMEDAMAEAKINPDQIGYINAHASSTQLNDANECACIKSVFGTSAEKLAVSGTKAFYGHPLGASPAIEGGIFSLAFQHSYIRPTLNFETPHQASDPD